MSKESKKREEQAQPKPPLRRKIVTAVLIVAAFAAVSYLGLRKRGSRFDTFAKCVASKQARMYGAYWCPHCLEQKEMFESSFQYVKHFPTWQFADGERREGTQPLPALGAKTGCALP